MKCKYCNSENLILEKRSKDNKHILDAQQVALICGNCGKYIKWCAKDERKFYWLNTNKKIGTLNKIEEFDKLMAEYNCQDVYELVKAMQHQLGEKDQEIKELKWFKEQTDKMEAVGMTTPAKINKKFEELKHQLAEKDKEIKHWKKFYKEADHENHLLCNKIYDQETDHEKLIDDFQQERENWRKQCRGECEARKRAIKKLKEIRHQVCEEIRDYFEKFAPIFIQVKTDVLDKLDQIEQGEKK